MKFIFVYQYIPYHTAKLTYSVYNFENSPLDEKYFSFN